MNNNRDNIAKINVMVAGMRRAMMYHGGPTNHHFPLAAFSLLQTIAKYYEEGNTPITATDLAKTVGVSLSSITQTLDLLEKKHLIERARRATDKRFTDVSLTKRARFLLHHTSHHSLKRDQVLEELFEYLGEKDSEEFVRLVGRINEFMASERGRVVRERGIRKHEEII